LKNSVFRNLVDRLLSISRHILFFPQFKNVAILGTEEIYKNKDDAYRQYDTNILCKKTIHLIL